MNPLLRSLLVYSYVHKEEKKSGGFPGGSVIKSLPVNVGDAGFLDLIPGAGNSTHGRAAKALCHSY